MSKTIISKTELIKKLNIIKDFMQKVEISNKIVFINIDCFYSYLDIYFNVNIKDIMKEIEPFIPLSMCISINSDLFYLLDFALNENLNLKQIAFLKRKFYDDVRITFLYLIKNSKKKDEWEKLISACEKLRVSGDNF